MSLTQAELKAHFRYDPVLGKFFRHKPSGKENPDGSTGNPNSRNQIYIRIDDKSYLASRLAWLYVHGYMPKLPKVISFRNGNSSDLRLENLMCTRKANAAIGRCGVKLALPGAHKANSKRLKKTFRSCIKHLGRRITLGTFTTQEEANDAYDKARHELLHHGTVTTFTNGIEKVHRLVELTETMCA